ncbi:MAG: NUDIX domain-containing protein [Bdellovibrionales bacterium]|nr:NUDIX domain-containing protein [Bdellovibrionales bacterium]
MKEKNLKRKVQVVVVANHHVLLFEFNNSIPNNYVGFQNITGEVEGKETFNEAAVRELAEEAGIAAEVYPTSLEYSFHDRWKRDCLEKIFFCKLEKRPEIVLSEEHLFCKWVSFNEVKATDYTFPSNYEAFITVKNLIEGKN